MDNSGSDASNIIYEFVENNSNSYPTLVEPLQQIIKKFKNREKPYLSSLKQAFLDAKSTNNVGLAEVIAQMLTDGEYTQPQRELTVPERIDSLERLMMEDLGSAPSGGGGLNDNWIREKVGISGEDDEQLNDEQENELEILRIIRLAAYRAIEEELIGRDVYVDQGHWNEAQRQSGNKSGDGPLSLLNQFLYKGGTVNRHAIRINTEEDLIDSQLSREAYDIVVKYSNGYHTDIETLINCFKEPETSSHLGSAEDRIKSISVKSLFEMRFHLGLLLNNGRDVSLLNEIDVDIPKNMDEELTQQPVEQRHIFN